MKRLFLALVVFILSLAPVAVALAAPSDISFNNPNPQDTSIVLNWTASNATITTITYKTTGFPANPNDGTVGYNSTGNQARIGNLTAGTVYYFSAWGFDGVSYSPVAAHLTINTLAAALPTGGTSTPTNSIPIPTFPSGASSNASIAGFNLEPFTSIIAHFNNSQGGLGMPINNVWETITILVIVLVAAMTYRSQGNIFVAYSVMFLLTCFAIGLHLTQWYLAPIELAVGMGVWGLERYFQ